MSAETKPSARFEHWRKAGLTTGAANILCQLDCDTIEDVRRIGPQGLLSHFGAGGKRFVEIAKLAGWETKPKRLVAPKGTSAAKSSDLSASQQE